MSSGRPPRLRGRVSLAVLTLLLLLLAPGESLAAASYPTDTTPLPAAVKNGATATVKHSSGSGGAFIRMIVGLFIVLVVIYGIYWLLKSYGKSKRNGGAGEGDGRIDVVATTALGPNRSLHLVRVGEELVLVGSAEQAITSLRVYGADESRRLEQHLDAASGSIRAIGERRRSGGPPLVRLVDELRKRTAR